MTTPATLALARLREASTAPAAVLNEIAQIAELATRPCTLSAECPHCAAMAAAMDRIAEMTRNVVLCESNDAAIVAAELARLYRRIETLEAGLDNESPNAMR